MQLLRPLLTRRALVPQQSERLCRALALIDPSASQVALSLGFLPLVLSFSFSFVFLPMLCFVHTPSALSYLFTVHTPHPTLHPPPFPVKLKLPRSLVGRLSIPLATNLSEFPVEIR